MNKKELLKKIPLFTNLAKDCIVNLSDKSVIKDFASGESIIRFGQKGKIFGAVVAGQFEAARTADDGTRHVYQIFNPFDVFGEMSLMTGDPTSADVTALIDSRAIIIPQEALSPVIAREPALMTSLADTISRRLLNRGKNIEEQLRLQEARQALEDPYGLNEFPLSGGGRILIIDCGITSLKYHMYDSDNPEKVTSGLIERIGMPKTKHVRFEHGKATGKSVIASGFEDAFNEMFKALREDIKDKKGLESICTVGHRIVYGGDKFSYTEILQGDVIKEIESLKEISPLYISANIEGINELMKMMPDVTHIAVFDSGFHKTIPHYASIQNRHIQSKQYGEAISRSYHGMSHKWVSLKVSSYLKKPFGELKLITCHLDREESLAAINHGQCIDATMGMIPLEDLIYGQDSDCVDTGSLLYIMRNENLTPVEMEGILMNRNSMLNVSGISSSMDDVLKAAADDDQYALQLVQKYCYQIKKTIGAFWASLGGLDALIFTGSIGEKSADIRARACQDLSGIGIKIDEKRNRRPKFDKRDVATISSEESSVQVLVVPTDEERMIAIEAARAIQRREVSKIMKINKKEIPIGVSAHHVHLCKEDVEVLFGKGKTLTFHIPLSQPGQFTCKEQVALIGPRGKVERVRVLGPERAATQVEIARTEEFKLGIDAPIRMSGDIVGTPGIKLVGKPGAITLEKGVICSKRHIHMTPEDALSFGLRDRDEVMVKVEGERSLIFGDVTVRVDPTFELELHLDTDEANAAQVSTGMKARLHMIQARR